MNSILKATDFLGNSEFECNKFEISVRLMYIVIRSDLIHRDRFDNFSMFFEDRGSEVSQDFSDETSRKDRCLFHGFDGFGGGTTGYANSCQTAVLVLSLEISLVINWVCLTCIIPLWRDVFTIYSEADSVERASIVQRSLQGSSPLVRTFHAHIVQRSLPGSSPLVRTCHASVAVSTSDIVAVKVR